MEKKNPKAGSLKWVVYDRVNGVEVGSHTLFHSAMEQLKALPGGWDVEWPTMRLMKGDYTLYHAYVAGED